MRSSRPTPARTNAYVTGSLPGLQAYVLANSLALEQYVAANRPVLEQFLVASPAARDQFMLDNPAVLEQYMTISPTALVQYLSVAENTHFLKEYLGGVHVPPAVRRRQPGVRSSSSWSTTTGVLLQYMSKPGVLDQFLLASPTVIGQFVTRNTGPSRCTSRTSRPSSSSSSWPTRRSSISSSKPTRMRLPGTSPGCGGVRAIPGGQPDRSERFPPAEPRRAPAVLDDNPTLLQDFLATDPQLKNQLLNSGCSTCSGSR